MGEFRIVIPTSSYEASAAFYAGGLGWAMVRSWPEPGRGAIFGTGGPAMIELLDIDDAARVTGVFCSVQVDDIGHRAALLAQAGIDLTAPVADQPWGHRNLEVTDPNGLRIVFFEVLT